MRRTSAFAVAVVVGALSNTLNLKPLVGLGPNPRTPTYVANDRGGISVYDIERGTRCARRSPSIPGVYKGMQHSGRGPVVRPATRPTRWSFWTSRAKGDLAKGDGK